MDENFNLKQMLDKSRAENTKLKQVKENLQERLDNKEL